MRIRTFDEFCHIFVLLSAGRGCLALNNVNAMFETYFGGGPGSRFFTSTETMTFRA